MDTKVKEVAEGIIKLILDAPADVVEVEGIDRSPGEVERTAVGDVVTFTMSRGHDRKVPGRRGPGSSVPIGRITYTVTVTAKYEPFDDEG